MKVAITKQELTTVKNNLPKNTDTSDDWFDAVENLHENGSEFHCPNCNEFFQMHDVEKNEDRDTIWCLECDTIILKI